MGYLVFCNTDDDGRITEALDGINVIPNKQYDYFFFLDKGIDVMDYKVTDGKLVKK